MKALKKPASNPNLKRTAGPGRPKGSVNKTTALLKDAILMAAEKAGKGDLVNYLHQQAVEQPVAFMSLLGKVLPMQITGENGGPVEVRWLGDDE